MPEPRVASQAGTASAGGMADDVAARSERPGRHTGAMLLARTVGLGELVVLVVIVGAVLMAALVAFRRRTDGDA